MLRGWCHGTSNGMKKGFILGTLAAFALLLSPSLAQDPDGQVFGFISFAQPRIVVEEEDVGGAEFTSVSVPLVREVGSSGTVLATVTVTNTSASDDFFNPSAVVTIPDGVTTVNTVLVLINDNIPEGNETFLVEITGTRLGAEIGAQNTMELVVMANDEPHGQLEFEQPSLVNSVAEPTEGNSTVNINVIRGPGSFGRVTIDFAVVEGGLDDISPTQGQLVFPDQVSSQTIAFTVFADDLPEDDEVFTLRLSNPTGGATLAEGTSEAQITILENDTPLRFSQAITEVSEDNGTVGITVTRGLLDDGSQIGNLGVETTVLYSTVDGTATAGVDYTAQSGIITFSPGVTSQTITISIFDDGTPEGDEMFTIVLANISSDAVPYVPSTATIVILVSDNGGGLVHFASSDPVVIGEDDGSIARFTIQRVVGTFNDLIVSWQITDSISEELAVGDFQPARGNITIPDGQAMVDLEIQAFDDSVPEVAEVFTVQLVDVVSGGGVLNEQGVRVATLIVADSDDVYGLVEWAEDSLLKVTTTTPRELSLAVNRSGSNIGIISVDYTVTYLPTIPVPGNPSVVTMAMGAVQLQGGQTLVEFNVKVLDDAFLEPRANFFVSLNSTSLVGGVSLIVSSTVSPRIGPRSEVLIPVPAPAANGYIAFIPEHLQASIDEPESGLVLFELELTRSGAFGRADVTWQITLVSAGVGDIGSTGGIVTIEDGSTRASINVTILADEDPEVDEVFTVRLLSVAQSNQRIQADQDTATVTITQNDNAEGIFSINATTQGPYFIDESSADILQILLQREGGALTTQLIMYETLPDGHNDFFGGFGFVTFPPNVRQRVITLFPQDDSIPETNETFSLTISSFDGSEDIFTEPTTVEITILANDDYAGVFQFASSSLDLYTDEPKIAGSPGANFTVQRDAGMFTRVTVSWEVGGSDEVEPTSGSVTFEEGQQFGSFEIRALPDEEPEQAEVYTVILTSVSGDGRLASDSIEATLTIRQNDDPINFNGSSAAAIEGQSAVFSVTRGGQANGVAEVTFLVQYSSASGNDVVVSPAGGVIVFQDGEREREISVSIEDDELPEESEMLQIVLTETTGDAVVVSPSVATLVIQPSDDPNGVFEFAAGSRDVSLEEGGTALLYIDRQMGMLGQVTLRWTVYQLDTTTGTRSPANSTDVSPTANMVLFLEGNASHVIEVNIVDDTQPEVDEIFEVELEIVFVVGDSQDGARLGNFSVARVTVPESDDPYGLFEISEGTRMVEVEEDVPESQPELGSATIVVERTFGSLGDVQVTWEILPQLEDLLPPFTDLLFFGTRGSSVSPVQSRFGTGTVALNFTGVTGSVVTVPFPYQPTPLSEEFTISLWLQPASGSSGVLVAKTTDGGSTKFYSLSLVADGNSYIIRFSYLPASQQSGFSSVEASIPQSSLVDGLWHSLTISVGTGTAFFYTDGSPLTSRTLSESSITDGEGELTVGGVANGDYYTGILQDVRIYATILTESQVAAIGTDTVSSEITPISGYLSFSPGILRGEINVTSQDDETPEPSWFFTLQLANSNGGSRIAAGDSVAYITVLKSDAGNGIFGFDPQTLSNVIQEPGNITLAINREQGTFETVFIDWEVRESPGGNLASDDFNPASGQLEFLPGETQEYLYLEAVDELTPELAEDFAILLVSATVADSQASSVPTSGASINATLAQSNLTVEENDYPYGLIQFVTSPPTPGAIIPPAISVPEIFVDESDGTVTVYVVRAQGNLGTVSVEYITMDGNASSTGLGPDYVPSADTLVFGPDDVVRNFTLTLLDDAEPELGKVFFVELTNPAGDIGTPGLDIGGTIAINILPSDDAFGIFSFSSDSLARVVEEQDGGTPVTLTVTRTGGTFGDISVYWKVEGPGMGDISPSEGVIWFIEGQTEGEIVATVADDLDPELHEVFSIRLVNVSGGATLSTAGNTVATVTIQANDFPYGLFVFSSAFRPLRVGEGVGSVEVVVTREFGSLGEVSVGYETIASEQVAGSSALEGIDVERLDQNSNIATTGDDYLSTSGSLVFPDGVTTQSFTLTILEDTVPELEEYIFVVLTDVMLNESSVDSVDTTVLPAIPSGNESLAFIIIGENDDVYGVIQFSSSEFNTTEPSQDFIFLTRTAGTFGEVSVQWMATPTTADTSDFSPSTGTILFPPGGTSATLPLFILDDNQPEFTESLSVTLVGIDGGARLGEIQSTAVNILPSDDPNGALEFSPGSRQVAVSEPEGDSPLTVPLTVLRMGGAVGVVEAMWTITANDGSDVSDDILPPSGTIQFVSNDREQDIFLSVRPDDVPEITENFTVRLVSVDGGAVINPGSSEATVQILPNDSPYGVVSFDSSTFIATEGDNDTIAMVPVTRSLGTFGDVRVTYTIQKADVATLATADGTPVLDYFSDQEPDISLSNSTLLSEPTVSSLDECARGCLSDEACLSFSSDSSSFCQLYLAVRTTETEISQPGAGYYVKDQNRVQPFNQAVATPVNDFSPAISQSITIPEGSSQTAIPVTIVGDTIPELDENLIAILNTVEIIGESVDSSATGPLLGAITETAVVISVNDDPYGKFYLFASNGESEVRVIEAENFGITLIIERRGGTLGDVQVNWDVISGIAEEGEDYAGSGAVLTFPSGVSRSSIAISILEDNIPERDEDIVIALTNPTGGATVAPGDGGTTLVIIEANDNAAGVVGLAPFSRSAVVGEGETASLVVERRIGSLGVVAVNWEILGPGNVAEEFVSTSGTAMFEDGANTTEIIIEVQPDTDPEISEPFTLNITSIQTLSSDISPSGHAILDSQVSMATITIQASDAPHGVVEFQTSSVFVSSGETTPTQLTLVRQFGSFGAIEVTYEVVSGNLTALPPDTTLATPGDDFLSQPGTITLGDGQQSTVITPPIVDDSAPELAEVFLVRLTSVTLLDPQGETIPPSLGNQNVAMVTIEPNDSPQGEFTFVTTMITVTEEDGELVLVVMREQGTLGEVSVVYLVTNQGATNGEDYQVETLDELVFSDGQLNTTIPITIINDNQPEVDEMFCVRLSLPEGGALLGNINQTCVTIVASDDAFGTFSFDADSLSTTLTEAGETTTEDNVAQLRVVRSGGLFGQVTVPYEVESDGEEDLSPFMGALVFAENEAFRILQVEAVSDSIPELDETYTITLLPPIDLGRLASNATVATITILANQDPYGVLEIFPSNNSMSVEEDVGFVVFEVRRSFGTIGEVSVTVATNEDTALAPSGDVLSLATIQLVETVSAETWYQFSRPSGQHYLVLGSSSLEEGPVLYTWSGVFTPIQTLSVIGAMSFTFLSVGEGQQDLLVVGNGGSSGNREVNSTVYQFTEEGQLQLLQSIPTVGASDVVSLQAPTGDWYIVFASREDNEANPNVDSLVLRWSGTQFELTQVLATIGASALKVFWISDTLYLAAVSMTDTRSQVFEWRNGQFRLHHTFDTQQVVDVEFISEGGENYLAVASPTAGIDLLLWSPEMERFVSNVTLNATSPVRVETVRGSGFLIVTNDGSPGQLFVLQDNSPPTEALEFQLPVSTHFHPFTLGDETIFIAVAISNQPGTTEQSQIIEMILANTVTDFYPRNFSLTFAPGENSHEFVVQVIDDVIPEIDEVFSVQLQYPLGGARLGEQSDTSITILTNDEAHGLIGFAESSLSVIVQELEFGVSVVLDVVREGGVFGEVRVAWEVSGEHIEGEVTPTSGEVIFPDGVSEAAINLLIQPDALPELNENTQITLMEITSNGVPPGGDPLRGAQLIPSRILAIVTVQANDAPHGVVVWSPAVVVATEEEGVENTVELTLVREFGSVGAILISYSTRSASDLPTEEQAVQGEDFVPTTGSVAMGDGETSANVSVTILHDVIPELVETFLVTITDVSLVDEGDSSSDSPRTNPGEESVQVQIIENDSTRGILSFTESAVSIEENAGSISLTVVRTGGTFGTVGAEFVVSGLTAVGGGVDFSPDAGTIELEMNQVMVTVVVNITNDVDPELEETFQVTLTSALLGSQLGSPTSVTVTILRNDDINGVFSFADDSLLFLIPESIGLDDPLGVATLTVERERNFVGVVTLYWEVSEDGRLDLEPVSGNLTFAENETEKSFQVRAIGDGIPELFESYVVRLVNAEGGGRIVDPREARIAIQASDDPSGVIGFDDYPGGIIIDEGNQLVFKLLRSAGLGGTVSVTWEIAPGDTTIFVTTSDTVIFSDGQSEATITVQTLSDAIPEVARLFSLQIISTNLARVDINSSQVDIVVTASDSPHGSVEFTHPLQIQTEEINTILMLPLQRSFGLIGPLRVNFSVVPDTAVSPEDFTVLNRSVVVPGDTASGSIAVEIINDDIPEELESFSIVLDSVELAEDINGGRDFEFPGDPILIDQPPTLGTNREIEVRILENDDPHGIVTLTDSTFRVNEGETAAISLVRTAGTIGAISIQYSFEDGSANAGNDYTAPSGTVELVFGPGQSTADILVPITADGVPELQEDFSLTISQASGGAELGSITMATVIIEASDSPQGAVGFVEADVNVVNPTIEDGPVILAFTVARSGGLFGSTVVTWSVEGPTPGREIDDIDPTQSTLVLATGQSSGRIEIIILPSDGAEPEETFTVTLIEASNNVDIDPDNDSVSITVSQRGMPFGVIGFFGDALEQQVIFEDETVQTLSLPLVRTGETFGDVQVLFEVTGEEAPHLDISPVNGSVTFVLGQSQASLNLQILPDVEPESEETFTVTLTGTLGGASLDEQATVSTFIIRANDALYGRFGVTNALITASTTTPITRNLIFTITRELGSLGFVNVETTVTYDPDTNSDYVATPTVSRTFSNGEREINVSVPINMDVYLGPNTTFTIAISTATLVSPEALEGSSPEISSTTGSVQAVVTEDVSNPLVGFEQQSLEASVTDGALSNNVALTITRSGQLGVVLVTWTTGLPGTTANGSILPPTNSVTMTPENPSATIQLTATPRDPHGVPEVFAVRLAVASLTDQFHAQVDPTTSTAIIEPQGVVQLGGVAFSALEGTEATVIVWRRYGSNGDITVTGMAMVAPSNSLPTNQEAAAEGTDFPVVSVSTTIPDGSTTGELKVPLVDNNLAGPVKVFQFTLTPFSGVTSPRLSSTNLSALVSIIDDETTFQFSSTSSTVEEGTSLVVNVTRTGWTAGSVTVIVRTVNGWVNGSAASDQTASSSTDYNPIDTELTFEENELFKILEIRTEDDPTPELDEYFTVLLENPIGGFVYVNPEASTLEVTIAASDNPYGILSLTPSSLTLTEDETQSGTITILRNPGLFGGTFIYWEIVPATNTFSSNNNTVVFGAGVTAVDISIELQANTVPVSEQRQFSLRISSTQMGLTFLVPEATITAVGRKSAVFQISRDNRTIVATGNTVTMVIERVEGEGLEAVVTYSTAEPDGSVIIGELSYNQAIPGVHYPNIVSTPVNFGSSENFKSITINIIGADATNPLVFLVNIATSSPHAVQNSQAMVVIYPTTRGLLGSLVDIYFSALIAETLSELETVSSNLLALLEGDVVSGREEDQSVTTQYIIDEVVSKTSSINTAGSAIPSSRRKRYTVTLKDTLLDIFEEIIGNVTFSGRSGFVTSMQSFGYSLLDGQTCPYNISETRPSYYLESLRLLPPSLLGMRFSAELGGNNDFLQYPSESIFTTEPDMCLDVHYIEFFEERLFQEPTVRSKVLSTGIRDQSLLTIRNPIVYRIYTSDDVVSAMDDHCLWWNTENGGGEWLTETNNDEQICSAKTPLVFQLDYIECECDRLGDFAASEEVVDLGYGWTLPAPLSCALVMIAMVLVVILHLAYFQRTQLSTRIFIMLCVAIFFFQLVAFIDTFAVTTSSTDGCSALGVILQFTMVAQFIWVLALAVSLWTNFMGITSGKEPLIIYIIVCWGTAVVVVIATIIIGNYSAEFEIADGELYGKVPDDGDICFMPELSASLLSTALPIMISILVTTALLSHSCIYWSRWEDFHSMYYDSFNKTEIPLMLVFFGLMFLSWLTGGLHMYIREVATFAIFVLFNVILGVYALVVYFCISWHTLSRKHKKYGIGDDVEPLTVPGEPDYLGSMSTLASSRQHLVPEDEWEDDDDTPAVVPLGIKRFSSDPSVQPSENGDSYLDELMYTLKTQSYPLDPDAEPPFGSDDSLKKPSGSEHLQLRRISIADTHL